jgi:hypothetical protein
MSEVDDRQPPYVLVTAAHNEEGYIEKAIESVASQTMPPVRWVIVDDGSVDATGEIVERHAAQLSFIRAVHVAKREIRSFASKSYALNIGAKHLDSADHAFIGHLDADISFGPNYLEALLGKFVEDDRLGVAGGFIYEQLNGRFQSRRMNTERSVAGAVQMFRRECYKAVGDFLALPFGGEDWHAEIKARMAGWRVAAFPDLKVYHHRPTCAAEGLLRSCYRQGLMDYGLGSHPLFEFAKVARRLPGKPAVIGPLTRLFAFASAYCRREKRLVSPEVVKFLQSEQMGRMASLMGR